MYPSDVMEKKMIPTASDQLDMEMMAEAELSRLQRQYRIMEGDRKAFLDEITTKLKKQRRIIVRLKKEKNDLVADIKVAASKTQKRKDVKIYTIIEDLLKRHSLMVDQLRKEKSKLEEIETQIRKTEKEIEKLKFQEVREGEYRERVKSGEKSIQTLKNKLDTMIKRFCTVLTENKQMREEIDHLLKERTNFNTIWEKLVNDLNNGKRFTIDLIEQATLAYDQREEWCSKLQALKIRAHNDSIIHSQEMKEMQRQLDHDGKLKEFLSTKGQKRVMKDLEERELKKKEEEKEETEKQMKMYEETLAEIKVFCTEEDTEKIASKYVKQEEENFALFNYVNELNHDLENLEDTVEDLKKRIDDQKELCAQKAQQQKETHESLNLKLDEVRLQAEEDEELMKKSEEELNSILDGIKEIFSLLGCDSTPILNLLGEEPPVTEDNALIYLGLIEKKISSLITSVYFKEKSLMKKKNR